MSTVTAADVAAWARVAAPATGTDDEAIWLRVLAAVTERVITGFGAPANPEEWTETQTQAVVEVTAEQLIAGRNTTNGVVELEGFPTIRANTIDYALARRLTPLFGFA